MKSHIAKIMSSTVLALVTVTAAQAYNGQGSIQPPPEDHYWQTPAQIQYWKEREARAPTRSTPSEDLFPIYQGGVRRQYTPEEIRYWKQREADLAKELRERPSKPDEFFPPFQYY